MQSVAADTAKGALIHRMIRAGVAHFAAHTNADSAVGGVNDALAGVARADRPAARWCRDADGSVTGSGRVGGLPRPMSLRDFAACVADRLPATVAGVRAAGDPDRVVRTVAVCGGAGDAFLTGRRRAGVDVYLTSDLRHHVVAEFVAVGGPGHPAVSMSRTGPGSGRGWAWRRHWWSRPTRVGRDRLGAAYRSLDLCGVVVGRLTVRD